MFEKTVKLIGKGVWALEMDNDSDNLCGSLIADLLRDLPNLKHLSLTYCGKGVFDFKLFLSIAIAID